MSSIEDLDEPLLVELFSYWLKQRGERRVPARADIDPVDIPQLLPHIALTEIIEDPCSNAIRVRYRLAGTQIEERFGCSMTNCYFDELKQGLYFDYIMGLYRRLMADMAPIYSENVFGTEGEHVLRAKRLMLPLSDDQKAVNMVLAAVVYVDSDPGKGTKEILFQEHFNLPSDDA